MVIGSFITELVSLSDRKARLGKGKNVANSPLRYSVPIQAFANCPRVIEGGVLWQTFTPNVEISSPALVQ